MTAGRYNTAGETAPQRQARRDATAVALTGPVVALGSAAVAGLLYDAAAIPVLVAGGLGTLPAALAAVAVRRRRPPRTTPADRVTLARVVLCCGCAAVTVLVLAGAVPARTWWLLALTVPTLLLDAADGYVARRTGSVTPSGARLDMQVDAGMLLVLSLAAAPAVGSWVLLVGSMRYVFVLISRLRLAWRAPLPYSGFRRVVAGIQGAMLAGAIAPVVPLDVAVPGVAAALALLLVSFGRDVATLEVGSATPRGTPPIRRPPTRVGGVR
jgi:phosphatidylglycerophosphate synthase